MSRTLSACVAAGLALWLGACASPKAPRFHSLLDGSAPPAASAQTPALAVQLAPVSVPAAVDQPQWVVRLGDDSLRMLEGERWAAPLRDEIAAALQSRWASQLGAVDARAMPGAPAVQVRVDVQRFESLAGREAWVQALWSVQPAGSRAAPLGCSSSVHAPAGAGIDGLAAAHRQAATQLADAIGRVLRQARAGEPLRCD